MSRKQQNAKFFQFADTLAQLMWLNLLTLVCSLPIVTAGASAAAMHYVLIHVLRDGKNGVTSSFFRAFRENFLQATAIWAVYFLIFALLGVDYITMRQFDLAQLWYVRILVPVIVFLVLLSLIWVFVILARYTVTTRRAFLFAITRVIAYPLKTLLMAAAWLAPAVLCLRFPVLIIVYVLLGVSGSGYLCSRIYSSVLDDMEDDTQK